ncbi:hypothetical protein [Brucella intermedia]|uniref:hypothetical protein n=1 Tax=Brucella intermedia TaxID=94625 RepID=UPI002361FB4F|nr:hypothetical protein [Brucella intermedia]
MSSLKKLFVVVFACLLFPVSSFAMGGYLKFIPPGNIPSQLDELDFFFRMVSNPGPKSFMYYAHNFALASADNKEPQLTGYIGPQSNGGNDGKRRTMVIATVWYGRADRLVSFSSGPESNCSTEHNGPESEGGWLIQCRVKDNSSIAQADMPNGTTYKISIKNIARDGNRETYEFAIQDKVTGKKTLLGNMTFSNIAGINSQWPSNFLENFGGDYNCTNIKYLAYTEERPIGISQGVPYFYTVQSDPDGKFDCTSSVSFSTNNTAGTVEYGIHGERP